MLGHASQRANRMLDDGTEVDLVQPRTLDTIPVLPCARTSHLNLNSLVVTTLYRRVIEDPPR